MDGSMMISYRKDDGPAVMEFNVEYSTEGSGLDLAVTVEKVTIRGDPHSPDMKKLFDTLVDSDEASLARTFGRRVRTIAEELEDAVRARL